MILKKIIKKKLHNVVIKLQVTINTSTQIQQGDDTLLGYTKLHTNKGKVYKEQLRYHMYHLTSSNL